MATVLRRLLVAETLAFAAACLIHSGVVVRGFFDPAAATAEGIIGTVLAVGAVVTFVWPRRTRLVALLVQGFALAGSLIGLFLVIRGVGPNTVPDVVFHVAIVVTLVAGLILAARASSAEA